MEASLSLDNLLVFVVIIMAAFAVPREHQRRVLIFGIITALGATLLSLLSFVFLIFGLLLLWTAVRLYRHRNQDPDIGNNALVRLSRRILPVSDAYAGGRLISRSGGRRVVTPLFIVFITIGGTDLLFAMDSIPAVFGVTDQPYIVFAANAFALLGLRALFFLVTGLLDRLVYLSGGLAVILAFIGVMPAAARPAASAMDSQIVTLVASISGPRCNGSGLASHLAPKGRRWPRPWLCHRVEQRDHLGLAAQPVLPGHQPEGLPCPVCRLDRVGAWLGARDGLGGQLPPAPVHAAG